MKLLDGALDKLIEASKPIQALADGLKACATTLEKLAMNLAVIAHNQAVHHQLIGQIWNVQQAIFTKLNERGLDMRMPDIDKPQEEKDKDGKVVKKNDGKDKPN